jgi:hypothetical protein
MGGILRVRTLPITSTPGTGTSIVGSYPQHPSGGGTPGTSIVGSYPHHPSGGGTPGIYPVAATQAPMTTASGTPGIGVVGFGAAMRPLYQAPASAVGGSAGLALAAAPPGMPCHPARPAAPAAAVVQFRTAAEAAAAAAALQGVVPHNMRGCGLLQVAVCSDDVAAPWLQRPHQA